MGAPMFRQSSDTDSIDAQVSVEWDGYKATLYRSPNSGDMVFDLETPEDYENSITVYVNDTEVT